MKFKLNLNNLLPGDIILVGYNTDEGREIQMRTECDYSHAMLYWYDSIIHASGIVITENPSRQIFDEDEKVCVLRLKDEFREPLRIDLLIAYARSFVGTFYDNKALTDMKKGKDPTPRRNRQMCARFIAQCYEHVLCDLVDDYETCTPKDILQSELLFVVNDPLVVASESDILLAKDYENDVTNNQYWAIHDFLKSFKKAFPEEDVVTLCQVEEFIANNPSQDQTVLDLLSQTEYFSLVDMEKEKNPYLYNLDLFLERFKEDSSYYACTIKSSSERIIGEKENDIKYYEGRIQMIGDLEYYRAMIELRRRIISNARERIDVANQVCEKNHIVKIKFPWLS